MVSKLHSELKSIKSKLEKAEEEFTTSGALRGLNGDEYYRKPTTVARFFDHHNENDVKATFIPKRNLVVLKFSNGKLPDGIVKVQKVYGREFYRVVARKELFPEIKEFFEGKKARVLLTDLKKFKESYFKKKALNGRPYGSA